MLTNATSAVSVDEKPLEGSGDTDVDDETSSDEDDFDGGLDTRVWNNTGHFLCSLTIVCIAHLLIFLFFPVALGAIDSLARQYDIIRRPPLVWELLAWRRPAPCEEAQADFVRIERGRENVKQLFGHREATRFSTVCSAAPYRLLALLVLIVV